MKKRNILFGAGLAVLLASAEASAADMRAAEPVFAGTGYQCQVFDRYRKDSGLMKLTVNGTPLIIANRIYASLKGADGKNISVIESAETEYEWKENLLTCRKKVTARDKDAEPVAETERKIRFSKNRIICEITVRSLRDLTLAQPWTIFGETLTLPTSSIAGMRADGIQCADEQPVSTLIPLKYDRKKWGFNKFMSKIILTDSENRTVVFSPGPQCQLLLNHYGGKNANLVVRPVVKPSELDLRTGTETRIAYAIEFGRAE